jgi:hypothetical protein
MNVAKVLRMLWSRMIAPRRWFETRGRESQRQTAPLPGPGATAATDGRWHLHVPYAAPKLKFREPLAEMISGYEITFKQSGDRCGVIAVEDLASVEEAHTVFAALKRGAVAASLNLSTGIRISNTLVVIEDDDAFPDEEDQPFTFRQGRSLARVVIVVGDVSFQIPKILEKLRQGLKAGFGHAGVEQALVEPRTILACRLFIDSHFEDSDEARLLSLMGVLEVLKDRAACSAGAQELVDRWVLESTQLDEPEASSFRGSLKFMKSISIGRGISSVVERHLGPDRAREARKLYGIRSTLVHDGIRPDNLGSAVTQAESIARDLLVSILACGPQLDGEEP